MIEDGNLPAALVGAEVKYEVHFQSDGSRRCGFAAGTWFQTSGLITQYDTVAELRNALSAFQRTDHRLPWLPSRIVQVATIATVIEQDDKR